MRIRKSRLRQLIRETLDIVNAETGEVIDFGEGSLSGIPEEAVPDLFRRLRIDMNRYASDENEYALPNDAWRKLEDETFGKQDKRTRKRKHAELTAEQERLNIDNLLQRLSDWAQSAADDYEADNPGTDIQDVAFDLADAAEYSFERDEWEELLWHFDGNKDDLRIFTMDSM